MILAVVGLVVVGLAPVAGGVSAAGAAPTRVHLIQGVPDTSVDVAIGGRTAITDLGFRGTYDLSALGSRLPAVTVTRAGTGEVLLAAGDVGLPEGENVTVVLHLKTDGSVGLASFANDVSPLAAGQSRLIVRHLAAAPPVDVLSAGRTVFENLANGGEVQADLPPGTVSASLVPAGTAGPAILGPADVTLEAGTAVIVYGLGSIERNTMAVATETIPGLGPRPTGVDSGNSAVAGVGGGSGGPSPAWAWLAPLGMAVVVLGRRVPLRRRH
ncbi:MAG: DUF4397 domain-containing protein [Acidimicrobiales bacterium]